MSDDSVSKSMKRQKLTAVSITLLALAFIIIQIDETMEAYANDDIFRVVLHSLAIIGGFSGIAWGWLRIREK